MPTEGGERAPPGSLLMACQTMQTGPLLPPPLCIHWLRCGLNLYGTRRFYPPGTRRFYLYSLAECRSPNSPLLTPPLLRLGFVGVLTSVPVALVIKREEKNKRIWDLREKRHKGVEKGDKEKGSYDSPPDGRAVTRPLPGSAY